MDTTKAIETLTVNETEWEKTLPSHILSDKRIKNFIQASRQNGNDNKIYAHVELVSVDGKTDQIIKKLKKRLKNRENILLSITKQMNKALKRKNEKIKILLGYIKLLENLLREHNIDFRIVKKRYKYGEINLASRPAGTNQTSSSQTIVDQYTDTVEIILDNDGNEILS
ncbi:MAG: hypothetical protein JXK07_13100 [Spirochaetes bacterium]|nr:hypothetical protein [Spirochaetota bacterium]MBN2769804.1 hypothetical protein [Spirochaetota bacterium]